MTQRFGRNRRRIAREAIATATAEARLWKGRAERAQSEVAGARERGMTELLKLKYLEPVIDRIGREIGARLAPELQRESRHSDRFVDLRAMPDPIDFTVTRIEARIPEIRCAIAVTNAF